MPSSIIEAFHGIPQKQVVGFSGSPRRNGNSDILLEAIVSGLGDGGIPAQCWNLSEIHFKGCIGCEKCRTTKICTGLHDGMTSLYPRLFSAQGLILVCPTHNYNITSWMKAFLDRLYCFYIFENDRPRSWSSQLVGQNRKAVLAAICEQESQDDMGFTLEAMAKPLAALGYEIVGQLSVLRIFDKARVKKDEKAMEEAVQLGRALGQALG
jgi:multimeric flavodoxin WrbA